ncbi:MAG: Adenylate cyclase [Labilithrix sp.]|nr:Adenylate cyclase [Labilithrix sp.]
MTLEENTIVADRFRLNRMIGRGGMGSVWQAFDTRLDISCALKFIEGELANLAEAHARFEREAKAAAALRSPHVVEIKDHGVWQGVPYIAMELLDGEDLGKALAKAGGKLPPGQINTVLQQVCRALTKAHQAGIVHRDLKPDNIFLVNDDDRQLVKILDFGVAKQTSQAIDGSNTKTGAMLGTPYYMSPEQAQGIKSVDSRSDLWSLAVIVYQCLTGRLPFESEALGDLLVKIIVHPIPVPSQVGPVPPGFDRWWMKAADRNPENRFATAKEFATSLEIALGASSVTEVGMSLAQLRGTAVMSPNANTVQTPPFASTPRPHAPSDPRIPAVYATPHPANPTPHGMVMGSTPHPAAGPPPGSATPATFSSGGASTGSPKKGTPVVLIAGIVAVVLVGLGGAGVLVARRSTASTPPPATTASASAVLSASAMAQETPPPPSASLQLEPTPPPPTSASAAITPATTAAAAGGVHPAPKPTTTGASAKPPVAPTPAKSAAAVPTASAKKKWEAGF